MSWHATLPPDTFVPPHIHPTQDEFIYMLEGQFELMLDGKTVHAGPRRSDPHADGHSAWHLQQIGTRTVKCLFWVAPTRPACYDLFWAIHNMAEQTPAEVVAPVGEARGRFLPPPDEPK